MLSLLARILAKTPEELSTSDLPDYAAEALREARITELHLLGRRGPVEAKWTNVELREMGRLADCLPVVDPAQLPEGVAEGLSEDLGLTLAHVPRKVALRRYDEELVTRALQAASGNRSAAARALGVSRMTVHRWIKRYGLETT